MFLRDHIRNEKKIENIKKYYNLIFLLTFNLLFRLLLNYLF